VRSLVLLVGAGALAGCAVGVARSPGDAGAPADLAVAVEPSDGGGAIFAGIAFAGCARIDVPDGGVPLCSGPAPLSATLVPLAPDGVTSWRWTMVGASPSSSRAATPTVTWSLPGSYTVSLVVGGVAGQASAEAEVRALAGATGAACAQDRQCQPGLRCACAPSDGGVADGGGCPAALAAGLCTRDCAGGVDGGCAASELCADLSRGGSDATWRRALCLPTCASAADCRAGFDCRDLPALGAGEAAGGRFAWLKGCFAAVPGDDGAACIGADGLPSPGGCLGGLCEPLGARDLCSSPCDGLPCPDGAACATFAFDPQHPFCLPRCNPQHACADPLLECRAPTSNGAFAFTVPVGEPPGATYCAPRRCAGDADCSPAGHCPPVDGGTSYCVP
jgi:hypothetical protein